MSEWSRFRYGSFQAELRVKFCYQGKPYQKQGQFWVQHPTAARSLRSGVFFSFEQALEAAGALLDRGIISENERKWLLSQAVFLPIFTKSHPLSGVWPRREEVLDEVFHDSMREAMHDWPHT